MKIIFENTYIPRTWQQGILDLLEITPHTEELFAELDYAYYIESFRTINMKLPRRSGKTFFLKKLLQRSQYAPILIAPSYARSSYEDMPHADIIYLEEGDTFKPEGYHNSILIDDVDVTLDLSDHLININTHIVRLYT